jgi:hypothetical protein
MTRYHLFINAWINLALRTLLPLSQGTVEALYTIWWRRNVLPQRKFGKLLLSVTSNHQPTTGETLSWMERLAHDLAFRGCNNTRKYPAGWVL